MRKNCMWSIVSAFALAALLSTGLTGCKEESPAEEAAEEAADAAEEAGEAAEEAVEDAEDAMDDMADDLENAGD